MVRIGSRMPTPCGRGGIPAQVRQREGRKTFARGNLVAAAGLLALASCTVPDHMRVRHGTDPEHIDTNVRFRTTYYFRVFDFCEGAPRHPNYKAVHDASGAGHQVPPGATRVEIDSIYRFRMTGKANALSNRVHFESGTLKSWQIDPFGASIEFDQDLGRFVFVSQDENRVEKQREEIYREISRLEALRKSLRSEGDGDEATIAAIDRAIQQKIVELGGSPVSTGPIGLVSVAQANAVANIAEADGSEALLEVTKLQESSQDQNEWTKERLLRAQSAIDAPTEETDPFNLLKVAAEKHSEAAGMFRGAATQQQQKANRTRSQLRTTTTEIWTEKKDKHWISAAELRRQASEHSGDSKALIVVAEVLQSGPGFASAGRDELIKAADYFERAKASKPGSAAEFSESITFLMDLAERNEAAKSEIKDYQSDAALLQSAAASYARASRAFWAAAGESGQAGGRQSTDPNRPIVCGDGLPMRRGFQVLGPEGWRTFDQDDRLIMAMSSEAEPLIGALQQISGRMLREQGPSNQQMLLPLVEERLLISNTLRKVETFTGTDPTALMTEVLKTFGVPEEKKNAAAATASIADTTPSGGPVGDVGAGAAAAAVDAAGGAIPGDLPTGGSAQ